MAFFGLALVLAGKTPGGLLSAGFAIAFIALAIVGAMMILFTYVTSIVNYQAGHAVAVGMATLSMAMAVFGGIGAFFILARTAASNALNSNLLLLAGIGGIFVAFDIASGVAIITS